MAITTVDGLLAGSLAPKFYYKGNSPTLTVGRPASFWAIPGIPGAGSFDTTLNGVVLSSSSAMVNGQIPFTDPGSGNSYLTRFSSTAPNGGQMLLVDRLWHNGGITITSTSAQTITSPTWPARDNSGATSGVGVLIGVEVETVTGAGTPTITVAYTNSSGTSGRSGTNTVATTASTPAGHFFPISLQAGDVGVQSVQSVTLSATWTSGTIHLVAYRVIAALEIPGPYMSNALDAVSGGMPQMFNGSVPFLLTIQPATGAGVTWGAINIAQG